MGQRRTPGLLEASWWMIIPFTDMRNMGGEEFFCCCEGRKGDEFKFD